MKHMADKTQGIKIKENEYSGRPVVRVSFCLKYVFFFAFIPTALRIFDLLFSHNIQIFTA